MFSLVQGGVDMSLGNNHDDSENERSLVMQEAAVQIEMNGLADSEAIRVGEQLVARRGEAEQSGQVVLDEQGNATAYHEAALNPQAVPVSKREAVNSTYQKLCANEGIAAF